METFRDKLAVVTGAGTGIGRELSLQLARAGAHVALCDVFEDTLAETRAACEAEAGPAARVSAQRCDVADESQVLAFAESVRREHRQSHIHLLFNNAGVGGGGSFVTDSRQHWEHTFHVCWHGVYHCTRAFMSQLVASSEACIVNVASINAMFALDPNGPHTAYSTASFAIKGFSESLLVDLRINAPHVSLILVMPGHIGTSFVTNTMRAQGIKQPLELTTQEIARLRTWLRLAQTPDTRLSDQQVREIVQARVDAFRNDAPISAAQAAERILTAVLAGQWRVLIGEDAELLDKLAREHPDQLYEPSFLRQLRELMPRR
jgi:NAD(P)-dependent dehydrogenase (short-subunit alcohol dehydrogenase family)